jgi:hypothetical protein
MASQVLTAVKATGSRAWQTPQTLLKVIFIPWQSSYEPVKSFLNDGSNKEQIGSWRDRKLAELTFVGVTVGSSHFTKHLFLAIKILE